MANAFLQPIIDSARAVIVAAINMVSKIFSTVNSFTTACILLAFTIDIITGGRFGIISGLVGYLRTIADTMTWPLVILIGVIIMGYNNKK